MEVVEVWKAARKKIAKDWCQDTADEILEVVDRLIATAQGKKLLGYIVKWPLLEKGREYPFPYAGEFGGSYKKRAEIPVLSRTAALKAKKRWEQEPWAESDGDKFRIFRVVRRVKKT